MSNIETSRSSKFPGPRLLLPGLALAAGCRMDPTQSALHPVSRAAEKIAFLWWLMFWAGTVIFLITMALLLIAIVRRPRSEAKSGPPLGGTKFVIVSGIVLPAIILVILLLVTMDVTVALRPTRPDMTIQVTGYQFWWDIRYPEQGIVTANELHIPAGRPVRLELTSRDVIHSFWAPRLHGKIDLIPGRINTFWIAADKPGVYRGQCAEYCGAQHAHMAFYVVALPPEEFQAWVAARQTPHPEPAASTPAPARGREVFFQAGCQQCHTIRGTRAAGRAGPDLSHLGSRLSLGAGTLPNTPGNLEGWISNSQAVKPGNRMPRMYLKPEDLHALRVYLESLK